MTRITQIEDRGAAIAWSPISCHADVIALGTKDSGAVGFDDYGGEIEFYDLGITKTEGRPMPHMIGSIKTTSRFSSIGWSAGMADVRLQLGVVAGGMVDGTVHVWNPSAIIQNEKEAALIASIARHGNGAVSALQFNPHPASANLLATGGADGEILVTSLDNPEKPQVTVPAPDQPRQGADISQIAWNSQVAHIVASGAGDGTVVVWDLRQNKPWCELRCEANGVAVTDLAWNPSQGLHMITASADDRNPVMKLWDLRASTTMPLATLEGHTQGVLSMAWCPHDDSLLLSCGKDNCTLLWDLFSLKPIAEIPNDEPDMQTSSVHMYGGGLGSSQQKRYDVQWSPLTRGVASTCSFDRKVQAHSVIGAATKSGRPPKWMEPGSGVSCGFGGTVVSFASSQKTVKISSVVERPELKAVSTKFEDSISNNDFIGHCRSKAEGAASAGNTYELQVWGFMQIIFQEDARKQLLYYLGFDPEMIDQIAMDFADDDGPEISNVSLKLNPTMSAKAEDAVKQALLVGNFEAAVECCFRSGNLADALILASCGGAELWAKAQSQYFASEAHKRPFLSVVNAVIHNKLEEFVASSNPSQWQETLAVLSTFSKSDEFPVLCQALGNRIEDSGDSANATLCYMCALNLEQASKYWNQQLDNAIEVMGDVDYLALHEFVEKVTVFLQALEPSITLTPGVANLFYIYAKALSDQGLFATAAKYCRSDLQDCKELRDRLYRNKDSQTCASALGGAPEFPFLYTNIGVAPVMSKTAQHQQPAADPVVATQLRHSVQQEPQQQHHQVAAQKPSSLSTQSYATSQPPPGWVELQDPSSGRNYYANQSTGETSWDLPVHIVLAPAPAPAHTQPASYNTVPATYQPLQQSYDQSQNPQQSAVNGNSSTPAPMKLASKYGDGFVTSASHPELAEQYGNVGTSNSYLGVSRPGTAVVGKTTKAPVSGTFDLSKLQDASIDHKHMTDNLLSIVTAMLSLSLNGSEQKQLAEIQKGIAIFTKRLARGDIEPEIVTKVENLMAAMQHRDYPFASAIQNGLVNSDWKEHKDWLRGFKFLIQLASKRI